MNFRNLNYDNSDTNWESVYVWVWDYYNSNMNFTGGVWPGERIELDETTGYYKFTFNGKGASKLMIIFSNGAKEQTADLELVQDGLYKLSGCIGTVSIPVKNNQIKTVTLGSNVISLPENAFKNCSLLSSLTLSNNITAIGSSAFCGCTGLTELTLPESLTSIGDYAFSGCSGLTELTLPESLTSIGAYAFKGLPALTEISIPQGVTTIGEYAFEGCYNLKTVYNYSDLNFTKGSWDYGCIALYADKVYNQYVGTENGFVFQRNGEDLSLLSYEGTEESITIPSSYNGKDVTAIADKCFYNNETLKSLVIPNSVSIIGNYAFSNCLALTDVSMGNSVVIIGYYAFSNCPITSISLPSSIRQIYYSFNYCPIEKLYISMETLCSLELSPIFGECLNLVLYVDDNKLVDLNIPDEVTSFPNWDFINLINYNNPLTSISTGNGLTEIKYAYDYGEYTPSLSVSQLIVGENIKSIDIPFPETIVVKSYSANAPNLAGNYFPKCEYGNDCVIIVDSPETELKYRAAAIWEDYQFSNMNNIAEVNVTSPGELSFDLIDQCGMMPIKVVSLKVNGAINADDFTQMRVNMASLINLDLSDASISNIPSGALKNKVALTSLLLPSDCQVIGSYAISNCSGITSIEIPASVKTIDSFAFVGTPLNSVTFNTGLEEIGDYAFAYCPLASLTLPEGLSSVGASAFEGKLLTQQMELPQSLVSIGVRAFAGQPLTGILAIPSAVEYVGAEAFTGSHIATATISSSMDELPDGIFANCPNLDAVNVPDNITSIGSDAFLNCTSLSDLHLPENLNAIGSSALSATSISGVVIPEGVTEISSYVLANCESLNSISLPSTTSDIEEGAFSGDRALRNIAVKAIEPPTVAGASAFRYINTDKCVISIPTDSYREYVLSAYWGRFVQMRNNITVETEGNGTITFDAVTEEVENEKPESVVRRAHALAAPRREAAVTPADNGSTLYVPKNGVVNFYLIPGKDGSIVSAEFNGKDIMDEIVNGVFTASAAEKDGKLVVKFSNDEPNLIETIAIDDIDNVEGAEFYNLQGVRIKNPIHGVYIRCVGNRAEKVIIR